MMQPNDESLFGYHFTPTDIEMLKILQRRIKGKSIPSIVIERSMYGENDEVIPWKIFKEDDPWEIFFDSDGSTLTKGSKILYVITKLMKMGKKNIRRVAGCGCWAGQTRKTDIYDFHKKKIGFRSMFTFKVKDGSIARGNWIMHEYGLDGELSSDYVICKIKRSGDTQIFDDSQQQISSRVENIIPNVLNQESQNVISNNQESIESIYPNSWFNKNLTEVIPLEVRRWINEFDNCIISTTEENLPNVIDSNIQEQEWNLISSGIQEQEQERTKKRPYSDCWSEDGEICPKEKQLKLIEDPNINAKDTTEEEELELTDWSVEKLKTAIEMISTV